MNEGFDYSKCSSRQLRNIAARIDVTRYPERRAAVQREIARRETLISGESDRVATPKIAALKRAPNFWAYVTVAVAFLGGALIGMMICSVASPMSGVNDVPGVGEMIGLAIGFFGGGIAGASWRLRTIERR